MLYGILLFLLILVSVILVIFVLMQSDKGGGLAGSLGGMGGGGMPFSGREAATILTKGTTILAITFMVLCMGLGLLAKNKAVSVNSNSSLAKRAEKLKAIESSAASSVLNPMTAPEGGILPSSQPASGEQPAQQGQGGAVEVPGLPAAK
ncbi:MAG: preprotein translocase subunit SecG [Fibrobacteres bacterium]|nr:preprotein translocase subunit SecG [Fibrobacterota bacterium]